jgi:putative FmdB family regulatory protein
MPIYEYVCEDCAARHERIVMSNGSPVTCPKCGSRKQTMQFSVFAAPANGGKSAGPSASSGAGCGCTPRTCGCH